MSGSSRLLILSPRKSVAFPLQKAKLFLRETETVYSVQKKSATFFNWSIDIKWSLVLQELDKGKDGDCFKALYREINVMAKNDYHHVKRIIRQTFMSLPDGLYNSYH